MLKNDNFFNTAEWYTMSKAFFRSRCIGPVQSPHTYWTYPLPVHSITVDAAVIADPSQVIRGCLSEGRTKMSVHTLRIGLHSALVICLPEVMEWQCMTTTYNQLS